MDTTTRAPVSIRDFLPTDLPFVVDSWCDSFRMGYSVVQGKQRFNHMRFVDSRAYKTQQRRIISALMQHATVHVACSVDDADQIYGWACGDVSDEGGLVLHYVYVKDTFRSNGFAKALITSLPGDRSFPIVITHYTRECDRAAPRLNLKYNPYLLYEEVLP